jgi:hypothetical protein
LAAMVVVAGLRSYQRSQGGTMLEEERIFHRKIHCSAVTWVDCGSTLPCEEKDAVIG